MECNSKRQRASNFTKEEKMNLLNIIKQYKHIIENKETGATYWKTKEETWKKVQSEFNSTSNTFRPAEVLKRFYNNIKKETRKSAGVQNRARNKTGGGQCVKVEDDPIFNLTLDIINKKSVFGLKNTFDSDSFEDPVMIVSRFQNTYL